jgi:uncharacterized protein
MARREIDLPTEVVARLNGIFSSYPEIEKVMVFGSRVLGNAKPGSDVDLAFDGEDVTLRLVGTVQNYLEEETTLPYFFDCVHMDSVENEDLRKHILRYGKIVYGKQDQ